MNGTTYKLSYRREGLCFAADSWAGETPKCRLASRDVTSSFLQGSSGTDSASFLGWCSWHLISSMDGRGGVLCSFFPEMIAFSLALLYPASLVGTASIFIYHYTVSLGMSGVVWSRYIWIYHSWHFFSPIMLGPNLSTAENKLNLFLCFASPFLPFLFQIAKETSLRWGWGREVGQKWERDGICYLCRDAFVICTF